MRCPSRGATRAIVDHLRIVSFLTPVEFGFRIRRPGTPSIADPSRYARASISGTTRCVGSAWLAIGSGPEEPADSIIHRFLRTCASNAGSALGLSFGLQLPKGEPRRFAGLVHSALLSFLD